MGPSDTSPEGGLKSPACGRKSSSGGGSLATEADRWPRRRTAGHSHGLLVTEADRWPRLELPRLPLAGLAWPLLRPLRPGGLCDPGREDTRAGSPAQSPRDGRCHILFLHIWAFGTDPPRWEEARSARWRGPEAPVWSPSWAPAPKSADSPREWVRQPPPPAPSECTPRTSVSPARCPEGGFASQGTICPRSPLRVAVCCHAAKENHTGHVGNAFPVPTCVGVGNMNTQTCILCLFSK